MPRIIYKGPSFKEGVDAIAESLKRHEQEILSTNTHYESRNEKKYKENEMIISQIIPFLRENENEIKINLASGNTVKGIDKLEPCFEYSKGTFKEWQERQDLDSFNRKYILSLIYIDKDEYLFAGIYEKVSTKKETEGERTGKYTYETKLLNDISQELIGRLIVSLKKDFRRWDLNYENNYDKLIVLELRKQKFEFSTFPGFSEVDVPFNVLKDIINSNVYSWNFALSNHIGVYLISDKSNGKLYVGSATGEGGFLQRWSDYIKNGHGENEKLKELIDINGYDYTSNFSFSFLDQFYFYPDMKNKEEKEKEVLEMENKWKEKLLTREFGYNAN